MTYLLPDNRPASFSREKFKKAILAYQAAQARNGTKKSQQEVIEDIAEAIHVSSSSVKHWLQAHNAPSDRNKVAALAAFLHIAEEDLLTIETKEDTNMMEAKTLTADTVKPMDYATTKDAAKGIYAGAVGFIELFRMAVSGPLEEIEDTSLRGYFSSFYTILMLSRFDISKELYRKVVSFVENYLQQMMVYALFLAQLDLDIVEEQTAACVLDLYETSIAPWWEALYASTDSESEDFRRFRSSLEKQMELDEARINSLNYEYSCACDVIIRDAYARLAEILGDYLIS